MQFTPKEESISSSVQEQPQDEPKPTSTSQPSQNIFQKILNSISKQG